MANPNPSIQHEEYKERAPQWKKCRDCIEGEDAVHEAGKSYLPMLTGQSADEYKAYVGRTPFYNATGRTIDGLVGMVFRKAPQVTRPAALDDYIADMTLTGCSFNEYAEDKTREVLSVYRVGVLVEYPRLALDSKDMTLAKFSEMNIRPYCTTYKAETIVNWRVARINNVMQPIMISLKEEAIEYKDAFESEEIEQYRVLLIENGIYTQRIYRKNKEGEWDQFGGAIIPLMKGLPLNYIPFVFFGANNNGHELDVPPLYDLVSLNISHYRTSADLEHGAHFTGLPTAVISGYQPATNDQGVVTEKFSIGSSTAWVFPQPDAKAFYLEFTGQGLDSLVNLKKEKEAAMAALGARMLAPEKQGVEAGNTVRMRHSGEGAVLSSIVNNVSAGMKRILEIMAEWSGVSGEITVDINKDFIESTLTAQEILAYVQAWQAGALPKIELFHNLKNGEAIRAETTYENYVEELSAEPPTLVN